MRHGERVDFTFGSWIPYCFTETREYIRKDLNMPASLPERKLGPNGFIKDSPLTNMGVLQATLVGEGLKEANVRLDFVYCSPSLRSMQTCASTLKGLNQTNIKIRIEPALFEWLGWYHDCLPDWLTMDEFEAAGFNIDKSYKPIISVEQLDPNEDVKQFYKRNAQVAQTALDNHKVGNILLVGHACTLEVCSRELLGQPPRYLSELSKIVSKIPYCGLAVLEEVNGKWQMVDPPCPPITHTNNNRFDWKMIVQ